MSTTSWQQTGTNAYTREEDYQPGTPKPRVFYLFLEGIPDLQFNWKLTVSENGGILFTQKFLLSGGSNTATIAQQYADRVLAQYIQAHPKQAG